MMKQLRLGLIGAGERGAHSYAPYALKYPKEVVFTCVAEPDPDRLHSFAKAHGIFASQRYTGWQELLEQEAAELDGVIIATQDKQHYEPTLAALQSGLHVLCEKPMAETYEKSRAMVQAAKRADRLLMVCHVLRYTPFFTAVKREIDAGTLGNLQAMHHIENIGAWHFAHSFVRGNWHNQAQSSPMIVAKCCHDMDILNFLADKRCEKLNSFGALSFFTRQNKPAGAAERCADCPHAKGCAFSAYHYFEERDAYSPFRTILENTYKKNLAEILEATDYGRCVWQCGNDVADHQTVNMEYEGGLTASFTASAFTADISRQIKIMGTKAELQGRLEDNCFTVRDFATGEEVLHRVYTPKGNHAGGDERMMAHFCAALQNPAAHPEVDAALSLAGHHMAFAAEESRSAGGALVALDTEHDML